jgi:hypothetical protein
MTMLAADRSARGIEIHRGQGVKGAMWSGGSWRDRHQGRVLTF